MLPALVDKLEAVAVGVKHIAGIVARIVVEPRRRLAVAGRAGRYCGGIGRVNLSFRVCHEADMRRPAFDHALPQPEEDAPLAAEALQVRMTRRAILAVIIDAVGDPERRQRLVVEGDRAFDIADG